MKNFNLYKIKQSVTSAIYSLKLIKSFTVACPIADIKGIKEKLNLFIK